MKVRKGLFKVVAVLFALSTFFSSCTKDNASEKNETTIAVSEKSESGAVESTGPEMVGNMYTTGTPVVKDKVTYTIAALEVPVCPTNDWNTLKVPKMFEEATNVHIEWNVILNSNYDQQKNLLFASNDLPDAFFPGLLDSLDEIKYGQQGLLIPLEELVDKWAPNITKVFEAEPDLKKTCTTPDGHIYCLATTNTVSNTTTPTTMCINKTWLDKLGLSMPKTTDDFYNVLKAFKEGDPNGNKKNDEIPFSFMWNTLDASNIFGFFGVIDEHGAQGHHRMLENDKVIFSATKPEMKDAIKFYNKLYKEGLIDQEFITQDTKQYTAKGMSDPEILGVFLDWHGENIVGADRMYDDKGERTMYLPLEPVKASEIEKPVWRSTRYKSSANKGCFAITSKCKNPEILMRWLDTYSSLEWALQWYGSSLETHWKKLGTTDDGRPIYQMLPQPEGMTYGEWKNNECPCNYAVRGYMGTSNKFVEIKWPLNAQLKMDCGVNTYQKYWTAQEYPQVYFTSQQNDRISILETDINAYVEKMQAKWLVNGGIDEDWDGFVAQLDKMGVNELVKLWQDAYDTYKKN